MGETIAKIKVLNLTGNGGLEIEALVDTGATYTMLPQDALLPLGIRDEKEVTLELADGRVVKRPLADVLVELEGERRANPIILGREGDAKVIGLLTLVACGLTVDPIHHKLVPLVKIHHYPIC